MPGSGRFLHTMWPQALFSFGFRPFFLGAALLAASSVPVWLMALAGRSVMPAGMNVYIWHQHEMVFGFVPAVIAGFALTAVSNWTGRRPVAGVPLAALFALWLAGRIAFIVPAMTGTIFAALIDSAFPVALVAVLVAEIAAGSNWRNAPVAALIAAIAMANIGWHVAIGVTGDGALATRAGLAAIAVLITLIGGRVTPSFTGNWMQKMGRGSIPTRFGVLDKITVFAAAAAVTVWVVFPNAYITGLLLSGAAGLHLVRLARWRGWATLGDPLVFVLHAAYLWLAIAFALMGAAALTGSVISSSDGLHALTAGAIGTMTIAVMTRASLGHTGRKLHADWSTRSIYILITLGAVLRVLAGWSANPPAFHITGGVAWAMGFLLFAVCYGPMLVKAKLDKLS